MDTNFQIEAAEPIYKISCETCSIIAGFDTEEEALIETAKELGFVALHSEHGTVNLCRPCFESDPELFTPTPIDMLLFCPSCGKQHVDEAKPDVCENCGAEEAEHPKEGQDEQVGGCITFTAWLNPPHKSHRCHFCNLVWRPATVPTNGVGNIVPKGANDTW